MDWKKRWTRTLAAGAAAFSLAAVPALAAPEGEGVPRAAGAAMTAQDAANPSEGTAPETAPVVLSEASDPLASSAETPAEGTPAPAVPAETPAEGMPAPAETPAEGTPAPAVPTETPAEGTPAPTEPSGTPAEGTPAPAVSTETSAEGTPAPTVPSETPAEGAPAPAVSTGVNADASSSPAAGSSLASAEEAQSLSSEEVLELYQDHGVKHTSQRYGYSIICPKKPNVIPASLLVEGAKGDVLIFENDGYDIKNAWVVLVEAFDDEELPPDMGEKSEADQQAYIDHLMNTAGYEFVRLTQVAGSTGVYAVTAKVIDVDTNGDGEPDETMVADNQGIKTFFRGQFGGRFSVQLIDNPDLSPAGVSLYQLGLLTFQEWPSAVQDGQNIAKDKDGKTGEEKKAEPDKK